MPSTARQLRQPPTIEAIERGPYFADVASNSIKPLKGAINKGFNRELDINNI